MAQESGYDKTYQMVRSKLESCDLAEATSRLDLDVPVDGAIHMEFLRVPYSVTNQGVECLADDGNSHSVEKTIIIYYVTSAGAGDPADDFLLVGQFASGPGLGIKSGLSWQLSPLERAVSAAQNPDALGNALFSLGAVAQPIQRDDMRSWKLRILPKIDTLITCYDADEDFPLSVQIRFDSGASRFLDFETIAFLQGTLASTLTHMVESEARGC